MSWKRTNTLTTLPTLQNGMTSLTDVFKFVNSRKEAQEFYELEAAEVIEVLLLEEDLPELEDGGPNYSLIGAVKARMVNSQQELSDEELDWILPKDANSKEYPIKGEYVIISSYMGMTFYSKTLNMLASVNANIIPGISSLYSESTDSYEMEYFQNDVAIRQLWPSEGDIILNGRFGQGIRFGSNPETLKPNIKLSVGHTLGEDVTLNKPTIEDINSDTNSVWMISDETINFTPATSLAATPDDFSGNQIFITTDRLILNSKTQETLLYAGKGFHIGTPEITTKIGGKPDEHLVLGETLVGLLEELIDIILKIQGLPTGTGPSGPVSGFPTNKVMLDKLKAKLNTILTKE